MTKIHTLIISSALLFALASCQSGKPKEQAPVEEPVTVETAAPEPALDGVTYEPAYPDDVSDEELSDEDLEQLKGHSHGPDGDHTHEEDEDNDDGHQ